MSTFVGVARYPILVSGQWQESTDVLSVTNPANDKVVGETFFATPDQLDTAIGLAVAAGEEMRSLPAYERARILRDVGAGIARRREELALTISAEAGKTIRDARGEVDRAVLVFRLAAEEAERLYGEVIPLDLQPVSKGRFGITRRFPVGPVAAISPFNFPLILAAHKVAPAIAAGCPVILKPPSKDPLVMLRVGQLFEEVGAPRGALSILPMRRDLGDRFVSDERLKALTFTGSSAVGWRLKALAGKKRTLLELGGNGGVIVDDTANLDWAIRRITFGSFANAGQICISVQRVFVHERVMHEFVDGLVTAAQRLVVGDPLDEHTDVGPMIDRQAVARTVTWVEEAVASGARVLIGGEPTGNYFRPTVMTDVPHAARICSQEAFAPVVMVEPFADMSEAIAKVNATPFGLQAGIFTDNLSHVRTSFDQLDVGGVIVNDVPTYRTDNMPYGGTKDSGQGREGIRYAIEELTESKLLVLAQPA